MIRKSELQELPQVMAIANEAWKIVIGNTGIQYKNTGRFRSLQEIEPYQNDFYVKVVKNEIVGVVRLIFDHDVVTIGSLAVLPQYQGMGYGRELLNFAESTRPKSQVYVVSCRTDNLPLYEKRGYKEISRCPAESIIPPETLTRDGLEMIKLQKE